jgi:hypothetical protein
MLPCLGHSDGPSWQLEETSASQVCCHAGWSATAVAMGRCGTDSSYIEC